MPAVGYVYDPLYLEHGTPGHPESPARLQSIISHLERSGLLGRMVEVRPRDATPADLALVHSPGLIARGGGCGAEPGGAGGEAPPVTLPLPGGCGREESLRAYREVCEPLVRRFRPQLLLVSAGFRSGEQTSEIQS